ncbi:MAG: group II intron maturase-specific domain-containing protein [Syntrophobacteraceae bacterium]
MSRLKEKIRQLTCSSYKKTLTEVIVEANLVLVGWRNYFGYGYPRKVFRDINHFVRCRSALSCVIGAKGGADPSVKVKAFMPGLNAMGCSTCSVCTAINSLRMPCSERLSVGWMREICTSGPTRGRVTRAAWPACLLPQRPKGQIPWKHVA